MEIAITLRLQPKYATQACNTMGTKTEGEKMITLSIRYTLNPNKLSDFKAYVEAELEPIRRSGGNTLGYFLPTDFSGPTNEALGLIDLQSLAAYEQYRAALAKDPDHQKNIARLEQSGAIISMNRSIIQRLERR